MIVLLLVWIVVYAIVAGHIAFGVGHDRLPSRREYVVLGIVSLILVLLLSLAVPR